MTESALCPQCGKTLGQCQCLRPNSQPTLSQDVLEAVPDHIATLVGYIDRLEGRVARLEADMHDLFHRADEDYRIKQEPGGPHD